MAGLKSDSNLQDWQMVDQMRLGNQRMLLLLQQRNTPKISRMVQRYGGKDADAEDVLQEALLVLWRKVQEGTYRAEAKIDTLLYAICQKLYFKMAKKNGRTIALEDNANMASDLEWEQNDYSESNDRSQVVVKMMDELGDKCRELLMLFYYEKWDMERIAQKMKFANAQTAKAKKYQCKKQLEVLFKKNYSREDLL